jgi:hypothetical protein
MTSSTKSASGERVAGAFEAAAFEVAGGVAQAGGVDEAHGDAAEVDGFLDGVAGGAGFGADDGAVEAEQAVEQAGFPGVGGPGDHQAQAVAQDPPAFGGGEQAGDRGKGRFEARAERRPGIRVDVLVGKVDEGLDVGEDRDEVEAQGFDPPAEAAGELRTGGAQGEVGLGGDHVHHRLGLGEVEFAI